MDADGTIQLLLGRPALHSCAEALGHLAGIWTQVVEPNNSVLRRAGVTAENIIDQTRGFKKKPGSIGSEPARTVKRSYVV